MAERPFHDSARLGHRQWAYTYGAWHEWDERTATWRLSADPPQDAKFFNYRETIMGRGK